MGGAREGAAEGVAEGVLDAALELGEAGGEGGACDETRDGQHRKKKVRIGRKRSSLAGVGCLRGAFRKGCPGFKSDGDDASRGLLLWPLRGRRGHLMWAAGRGLQCCWTAWRLLLLWMAESIDAKRCANIGRVNILSGDESNLI